MSTTVPAPEAAPSKRSTGAIVAIVLGAVAAAIGVVIAIGGGAVWAAFGSDGLLSTSRSALSTPTSALISETATINDTAGASDVLGDTSIRISARGATDKPVFVGVGPAPAVERYLSGVAVDEVTDFDVDPFRVQRNRLNGAGTPAAPGTQSFWLARGSGRTANIDWKVRDGDYRVVIMNADGARGVATRASVAIKVPYLPGVAIGVLIGGLLLVGAGVAAIGIGAQRPRRTAS